MEQGSDGATAVATDGSRGDASSGEDRGDVPDRPDLTVYYDGGCPLCRREIAGYRKVDGAERLAWIDLSTADAAALGAGLDRERAMARMHVRDADGRLVDGAAAFARLWTTLPRTRLLGRLASTPLALAVLEPAYRVFLKVRPLWRRA